MSQALAGAAVGTLARREARRTARHPVYLVLLLYFLVLGGVQAASLGPAPWTMSPGYYDDVRIAAGSHGWHAVHLLGLGLLAAALLRYPAHRRPLLALGAAVLGSAHRTPITPGEGQGKGRNRSRSSTIPTSRPRSARWVGTPAPLMRSSSPGCGEPACPPTCPAAAWCVEQRE